MKMYNYTVYKVAYVATLKNIYFLLFKFWSIKKKTYLCIAFERNGAIAQLVEQRTENPCVPGSIPGGTTVKASY